jgi:5-methylcytosine-specific restriction protein B
MVSTVDGTGSQTCWFVGSWYGANDDQTPRFLKEGIWENGYDDKFLDLVKSIKPGDRIAIKSTYIRKNDLPFDNRKQTVSVMAIKAVGTVTENLGDGRTVRVDWNELKSPREWYFYTYRQTIWRVIPGEWISDALIEFTFEDKPQDIDRFRNEPFWRDRFGDTTVDKQRFKWTRFYEAIADKLLDFKDNRSDLVAGIYDIAKRVGGLTYLQDHYTDGTSGPFKDICPFTVIGIFNRGITDANRKLIATELAKFLGVEEDVPLSFEGIPVLNNFKSCFFANEFERQADDIDALWEIFAAALAFVETDDSETKSSFITYFDNAIGRSYVGWNLTFGLYWIRPWRFLSLDIKSQLYINKILVMDIPLNGPKKRCNADDYLSVMDKLETRYKEEAYPVHSFPELSLEAWLFKDKASVTIPLSDGITPVDSVTDGDVEVVLSPPIVPYSVDNILSDGCFIERIKLVKMLERLRTKKNLILQGPPGTGKTWLARRLAFALMSQRDDSKVRALQFHPNLSYEDFVRGWRPTGEGKLSLVDGPFLEMVTAALNEPSVKYVVVIEEINRGNPAQVFGEMLTLLEADKRTPTEALELCYRRKDGERIFIPDNLYVIGTMNIADRSLALVDLALRRRFAFIDLEPILGKVWQDWVAGQCGIELKILVDIEKRISVLNEEISADNTLGPQFRIGHSYVTPPRKIPITNAWEWFKEVVQTEIGPLLDEYWFDALYKAQNARQKLIEGL